MCLKAETPPPFTVAAQGSGEPARTLSQVAQRLAEQSRHDRRRARRAQLVDGRGRGGLHPLQDELPAHRAEGTDGQQIPSSLQQ